MPSSPPHVILKVKVMIISPKIHISNHIIISLCTIIYTRLPPPHPQVSLHNPSLLPKPARRLLLAPSLQGRVAELEPRGLVVEGGRHEALFALEVCVFGADGLQFGEGVGWDV